MSEHNCPLCGQPLEKKTNVIFTQGYGLSISELRVCRRRRIRYDCERCNFAFLFFGEKICFWDRNGERDGFKKGWNNFKKYTGKVKVQFT